MTHTKEYAFQFGIGGIAGARYEIRRGDKFIGWFYCDADHDELSDFLNHFTIKE